MLFLLTVTVYYSDCSNLLVPVKHLRICKSKRAPLFLSPLAAAVPIRPHHPPPALVRSRSAPSPRLRVLPVSPPRFWGRPATSITAPASTALFVLSPAKNFNSFPIAYWKKKKKDSEMQRSAFQVSHNLSFQAAFSELVPSNHVLRGNYSGAHKTVTVLFILSQRLPFLSPRMLHRFLLLTSHQGAFFTHSSEVLSILLKQLVYFIKAVIK